MYQFSSYSSILSNSSTSSIGIIKSSLVIIYLIIPVSIETYYNNDISSNADSFSFYIFKSLVDLSD